MQPQTPSPQSRLKSRLRPTALQALLLVAQFGCEFQRGKFVTTANTYLTFSTTAGCVDVIQGYPADAAGRPRGPEQNLLYFVIICPGASTAGASSSGDFGTYVTTLKYTWRSDTGDASVQVLWDRQKDTVTVGSTVLRRANGNLVVVLRRPSGDLESRQLPSLGPKARFADALQAVRRQMPDDSLIASLRLSESPATEIER